MRETGFQKVDRMLRMLHVFSTKSVCLKVTCTCTCTSRPKDLSYPTLLTTQSCGKYTKPDECVEIICHTS